VRATVPRYCSRRHATVTRVNSNALGVPCPYLDRPLSIFRLEFVFIVSFCYFPNHCVFYVAIVNSSSTLWVINNIARCIFLAHSIDCVQEKRSSWSGWSRTERLVTIGGTVQRLHWRNGFARRSQIVRVEPPPNRHLFHSPKDRALPLYHATLHQLLSTTSSYFSCHNAARTWSRSATGSIEPSLLVSPFLEGPARLRPFAPALHLHQCKSSRNLHLQYSAKSQSTPCCQSLITPRRDRPPVLRCSRPH
jgi:hypothetical protein